MSTAIQFRKETNGWEFNGQAFLDGTKTFSKNNRLYAQKDESGNALIIWRAETAKGRKFLSDRALGELIGFCLGNGITWVSFKCCTVSVNYLTKALAFKAKTGWFVDFLVDTGDHKFDGNVPTPGGSWGEAKALLAEATERTKTNYAGLCRAACRFDEADEEVRAIAALKQRASELMYAKR
ncbi:MAG: hypothetical protein SGJ27_10510 [Candidatus Melainabacteria bacterium]|nr:hypothetical protein [Candidatus Melainabacteria bacterium]